MIDVELTLYGEVADFDGKPYALIRKLSAVSEDPDFPDMLCVNVRPIKMVNLDVLGEGEPCRGECGMPSRSRKWITKEPFLQDFIMQENPLNVLW